MSTAGASLVLVTILALITISSVDYGEFPHLDGKELDLKVINPGPATPPRPLPELSKISNIPPNVLEFLKQPIINPHPYGFYHDMEDRCVRNKTRILIVIPSAPDNFLRRQIMRQSSVFRFAQESSLPVTVLFFLGFPKFVGTSTYEVQSLVNKEIEEFGDIVQAEFKDVYGNIRLKAQSMLKWASTYCYNASYVIRIDDDVIVDPDLVIESIFRIGSQHHNFVLGDVKTDYKVIRNNSSGNVNYDKYAVPYKEYRHEKWPPFALGGLLGYPLNSVRLLYEASLRVKAVWLDDVYITGICAQYVNVTLLKDDDFVFQHSTSDISWPEILHALSCIGMLACFISLSVRLFSRYKHL